MCREHSTQNCEYTGDEYGFTEHFKNYDDLLIYIKENTNFRFKQEPKGLPANCIWWVCFRERRPRFVEPPAPVGLGGFLGEWLVAKDN
jgi:hypothetical protein